MLRQVLFTTNIFGPLYFALFDTFVIPEPSSFVLGIVL